MSHEARINEALRQLGEEHRLGMVQPEEYKARRRLLIEAWNEKEVTTSPGSLRKAGFGTIPPGQNEVKLALKAPEGAALGNRANLTIRATAVLSGVTLNHDLKINVNVVK